MNPNSRWQLLVLLLLLALGLIVAAHTFHIRTDLDWNSVRTAVAVAYVRGGPLYYGPTDGPLWGNIYPPLGHLLTAPAALATTPTAAIRTAQLLSVAWIFIPLAALGALASPRRRPLGAILALALALPVVAATPSLTAAAFHVHVDGSALGLALTAALLTAFAPGRPSFLFLAGALAVACVFCKQTAIAVPATLVLWTLITRPRREALAFLTGALAAAAGLKLWCLLAFDPRALWYETVTVPSRHGIPGGLAAAVARRWTEFTPLLIPHLLVATALQLLAARDLPRRNMLASPGVLLFVLALAQLPLALAGYFKIGGGVNNLAAPALFFLAAALYPLLTTPPRHSLPLALSLAAALGLWRLFALHADPTLSRPDQHAMAYRALLAHPGKLYFPRLPLSHLLAENRLTHHTWGVNDRVNAGEPVPDPWLRAFIPPDASALYYFHRTPGPTVLLHVRLAGHPPTPVPIPPESRLPPGWVAYQITLPAPP